MEKSWDNNKNRNNVIDMAQDNPIDKTWDNLITTEIGTITYLVLRLGQQQEIGTTIDLDNNNCLGQ